MNQTENISFGSVLRITTSFLLSAIYYTGGIVGIYVVLNHSEVLRDSKFTDYLIWMAPILLMAIIMRTFNKLKRISVSKLSKEFADEENTVGISFYGGEILSRIEEKQSVYMDSWKSASYNQLLTMLDKELKELSLGINHSSKEEIRKKSISAGTILFFMWCHANRQEPKEAT